MFGVIHSELKSPEMADWSITVGIVRPIVVSIGHAIPVAVMPSAFRSAITASRAIIATPVSIVINNTTG